MAFALSTLKGKMKVNARAKTTSEEDTDALNHLLNLIDSLDRDVHLGTLRAGIRAAKDQLTILKELLEKDEGNLLHVRERVENIKTYAAQVSVGEIESDARTEEEKRTKSNKFLQPHEYRRLHEVRVSRACAYLATGERDKILE